MEIKLEFAEVSKGLYEAEFVATANFNLHLEREGTGLLVVKQRGVEKGEYSKAFMRGMNEGKKVFDYDFGALIYPKWIKIESGSKVVSGIVTFSEG